MSTAIPTARKEEKKNRRGQKRWWSADVHGCVRVKLRQTGRSWLFWAEVHSNRRSFSRCLIQLHPQATNRATCISRTCSSVCITSARLAHNTLPSSEFTLSLCSSTEKRAEVTPLLVDSMGGEMLFTELFNITLHDIVLHLHGKLYFKLTNIVIEIHGTIQAGS